MLNKFSIRFRLAMLIAIQAVLFIIVGSISIGGLNYAISTTDELNNRVQRFANNLAIRKNLRDNLLDASNEVSLGVITWNQGLERINGANERFEQSWKTYLNHFPVNQRNQFQQLAKPENIREAFDTVQRLFVAENQNTLKLFLINDMGPLFQPMINFLAAQSKQEQSASISTLATAVNQENQVFYISTVVFIFGLILIIALGIAVYQSISHPVERISSVVNRVAGGDFAARTNLYGVDEIVRLGSAFDNLLEDRVTALAESEHENDQLNNSVISLLQTVSRLSNKDLTVRAAITDDIAGPLADAINQLATETGNVMAGVQSVADNVEDASSRVNQTSRAVNQVAKEQQVEIQKTAVQLADASEGMNRIAALAEQCNNMAQVTTESTDTAVESVQGALTNIQDIREIIQETGKRIKRLGERSQEISTIVDIINGFAERTTVLALNASMQAAAAGDAGRGFAVVADEVQRLAESSRNATGQISTLVKNIQVETGDTMATMDRAIHQVVNSSEMANMAREQLQDSNQATVNLVDSVGDIAINSSAQAKATEELLKFAASLREQTVVTSHRLEEQLTLTENLDSFAKALVSSVNTFKIDA